MSKNESEHKTGIQSKGKLYNFDFLFYTVTNKYTAIKIAQRDNDKSALTTLVSKMSN